MPTKKLTHNKFRNQYDNDATTFSPQGSSSNRYVLISGRLHQVEYALEAIKQGSCAVGLVSKTHAVVVALKVLSTSKLVD